MTVFTKKAIEAAYIEMLQEKPLREVTINDISKKCGINRNTFYYHYSSVLEVIEEITKRFTSNILGHFNKTNSLKETVVFILQNLKENKTVIKNLYDSMSRSIFEKYVWKVSEYVVSALFDACRQSEELSEDEYNICKDALIYEFFGFVLKYINDGMPKEMERRALKMDVIFNLNKIVFDEKIVQKLGI